MAEIIIDTDKLRQYATRIGDVNSRLSNLDRRLNSLYLQVGMEDGLSGLWNLLQADIFTSYSSRLAKCKTYLEKTAGEFETVETELADYDPANFVVPTSETPTARTFSVDYDFEDFIKSFGKAGSIVGIASSVASASTWNDWAKVGVNTVKTVKDVATKYNHYMKISPAIGSDSATHYFWRNFFGFNSTGYASTAGSLTQRFRNNLTNSTSAYNLKDSFSALTGGKGAASTAIAWGGVLLTGVSNYQKNLEEQKETGISTGRVIAETVTETAIDTVISYAGTAVVGSAIAAVTGVVAAPVVVAVATGVAIAGINAVSKYFTGKSATELISDAVLDTAEVVLDKAEKVCETVVDGAKKVGKAVSAAANSVASWFSEKLFG